MKKTLANKMWPSPTPQNCQQLKKFKVKERVDMVRTTTTHKSAVYKGTIE